MKRRHHAQPATAPNLATKLFDPFRKSNKTRRKIVCSEKSRTPTQAHVYTGASRPQFLFYDHTACNHAVANHCPERFPDSTPKPTASLSLRSGPTNQGVELKKRRRKFPLNTCVHSDSKAVGRRRGASGDGPSGAMSAAAGNCGPCPTRCKGTLSVVTRPLPMVPSRVGGLSATLGGTSQDRTVSSRAPLAGGIGEQQI